MELILTSKDSLLHARLSELQLSEHKDRPANRGGLLAAPAIYLQISIITFNSKKTKNWPPEESFCCAAGSRFGAERQCKLIF
jgi:hypothetical protein